MKAEVETQRVQEQIGAERVRRGPAEILTDVARPGVEDLGEQRDTHEEERDRDETADVGSGERAVDEPPQELRVRDLQADGEEQQHAEQRRAPPLRSDVTGEERDVASPRVGHAASVASDAPTRRLHVRRSRG